MKPAINPTPGSVFETRRADKPDASADRVPVIVLSAPRKLPGQRWAERRWEAVTGGDAIRAALLDPIAVRHTGRYAHNIERYIGTARVPVGVAGPLRINGGAARGEFTIPLATTEAALVASYHRGARAITAAGGCNSLVLAEALNRTPAFAFTTLHEVRFFLAWLDEMHDRLARIAATTTQHGRLITLRPTVEGNHVYLGCEFSTGDAAGQNMVTLATEAIVRFIVEHAPVKPQRYYLEANLSGDKKATAQSLAAVRGRRVTADVILPAKLVRQRLRTTAAAMIDCWRTCAIGGSLSGSHGFQGQYANGLAALFLACGQDVACVAESAVGITRMEGSTGGGLYAAVTLPALVVGTVGGGTGLPTQRACLDILGLAGNGHASAFAEVCAALLLAGELSLIAALSAGEFAGAHRRLARGGGCRV